MADDASPADRDAAAPDFSGTMADVDSAAVTPAQVPSPTLVPPAAEPGPADGGRASSPDLQPLPTAQSRPASYGPPPRSFAPAPSPARPPQDDAAIGAPADPALAAGPEFDPNRPTCTQAQLRRFIKSRPWIPMHELRRRFGILGGDDDVTPVRIGATTIYVGMPLSEGRMLGDLLSGGDVGYELSLDPITPIVIGVYPMRPVPRG